MTNIIGIVATVGGSTWIALANTLDLSKLGFESLGGYGLLVSGVLVLWRELKAERLRSDEKHAQHIEFTRECTKVLQELKDKKCDGCKLPKG
jgi:hypothetical protein